MCKTPLTIHSPVLACLVKCTLDGGIGQKEGKVNSRCASSEEMECFRTVRWEEKCMEVRDGNRTFPLSQCPKADHTFSLTENIQDHRKIGIWVMHQLLFGLVDLVLKYVLRNQTWFFGKSSHGPFLFYKHTHTHTKHTHTKWNLIKWILLKASLNFRHKSLPPIASS